MLDVEIRFHNVRSSILAEVGSMLLGSYWKEAKKKQRHTEFRVFWPAMNKSLPQSVLSILTNSIIQTLPSKESIRSIKSSKFHRNFIIQVEGEVH